MFVWCGEGRKSYFLFKGWALVSLCVDIIHKVLSLAPPVPFRIQLVAGGFPCAPANATLCTNGIVAVTRWDSDLEVFSCNPVDGSFVPLATWPRTYTKWLNLWFLSYCSGLLFLALLQQWSLNSKLRISVLLFENSAYTSVVAEPLSNGVVCPPPTNISKLGADVPQVSRLPAGGFPKISLN